MKEEKIYTCICGKTFTKPNAFNGHKSHCSVHLFNKGTLDKMQQVNLKRYKKISTTLNAYYNSKEYIEQKLTKAQLKLIS